MITRFSKSIAVLAPAILSLWLTIPARAQYWMAPPAPYGGGYNSGGYVYNWNEVPPDERVTIVRATFDQSGYELYDDQGDTILVPFDNGNLYVMKFAPTGGGRMYFANGGDAPVLYVPNGGYLENAAVPGARWYPFSPGYRPSRAVYLGIAPSWDDFCGMNWYSGMECRGGYWCESPFNRPFLTIGFFIEIGGRRCHDWRDYDDYCRRHDDGRRFDFSRPDRRFDRDRDRGDRPPFERRDGHPGNRGGDRNGNRGGGTWSGRPGNDNHPPFGGNRGPGQGNDRGWGGNRTGDNGWGNHGGDNHPTSNDNGRGRGNDRGAGNDNHPPFGGNRGPGQGSDRGWGGDRTGDNGWGNHGGDNHPTSNDNGRGRGNDRGAGNDNRPPFGGDRSTGQGGDRGWGGGNRAGDNGWGNRGNDSRPPVVVDRGPTNNGGSGRDNGGPGRVDTPAPPRTEPADRQNGGGRVWGGDRGANDRPVDPSNGRGNDRPSRDSQTDGGNRGVGSRAGDWGSGGQRGWGGDGGRMGRR